MKLINADALWMDVIHAMDYCDDILEIIEKQPTIEERETGAWKDCGVYADLLAGRVHQCSICGARFSMANERYTYCPNCGSKMEGIHESE